MNSECRIQSDTFSRMLREKQDEIQILLKRAADSEKERQELQQQLQSEFDKTMQHVC